VRNAVFGLVSTIVGIVALSGAPGAAAYLSTRNISPFPASKVILGARWTSPRYGPPTNQWGDILPTIWGDDGNQYTVVDDGATDVSTPGALWKQSIARITGTPPKIHISHVGDPDTPPPHTYPEIHAQANLWNGPLGPYYSSGLVEAGGVLFATQENDWNWAADDPFAGLHGIAYSTNHGQDWTDVGEPFPAPLGNLSWVIRGRGGVYPDGYVYAIGTEREFNASTLLLGRARADIADLTDPAKWQWLSGWTPSAEPTFSSNLTSAIPAMKWASHITYPEMAYDAPLHRYLLTFTYSYASTTPAMWRNGAELLILESPRPWGPFSFVAHEPEFGPSNGYAPGIPIQWISRNGQDLWMKWAANFDGCAPGLNCSGGYGFNYRRLHLTLAGGK
jgi:hypothetical protein